MNELVSKCLLLQTGRESDVATLTYGMNELVSERLLHQTGREMFHHCGLWNELVSERCGIGDALQHYRSMVMLQRLNMWQEMSEFRCSTLVDAKALRNTGIGG